MMKIIFVIIVLGLLLAVIFIEEKNNKLPELKEGEIYCKNCHGTGWSMHQNGDEKCPVCNGTGKLKKRKNEK